MALELENVITGGFACVFLLAETYTQKKFTPAVHMTQVLRL